MAFFLNFGRRALVLLLVLICSGFSPVLAQPTQMKDRFADAMAAYSAGDYQTAHHAFDDLAQIGHSGAETMLGVIHYRGLGVEPDAATAAIWFYKAARRGNANAQLAFASLHLKGEGVDKAPDRALVWLILAQQTGTIAVVEKAEQLLASLQVDAVTLAEAQEKARLFQPMAAVER